jgi:PAS domain S-box-containing protein
MQQDKIKLLVIEDDLTQAFLIKESLDEDLYDISNILDGREALDYLLNTAVLPDLVLMDYHLPSIDGIMIMNKLKEQGKKFNIIFLTADYSIDTAIRSINAGALEFIPKDGRFVNNIQAILDKAYQTVKARAEREKFELALKESESRFKMVMEASKEGIFEWSRKDQTFHVSPNNSAILGYKTSDFPSSFEEFSALVHPEDREMFQQKFTEHLNLNTPLYEAEVRVLSSDGTYKWLLHRGIIAEKDDLGIPVRVIGTHSDISERKASEEKIIEANLRLTTLIGNLPGIVYRCKGENILEKEYLGGRVEEITGYSENELTTTNSFSFGIIIFPEDLGNILRNIDVALASQTDFEMYYRIISKSGEIRWVSDHGKIISNKKDKSITIEGYITDITEKRLNEEALRKSEEEKNIILDNSLQAFILCDPKGSIIAFNKVANHRAIVMVGKTIKKGQPIFDYITTNEKGIMMNHFSRVIKGEPAYWEHPFDFRGDTSWFETVLVPVFISREEIKFVCYTSSDITERKMAEEKIVSSENLYNTTINSLNDLFYVVDEKLDLLLVNEALLRFNQQHGFPITLAGINVYEIFPFLHPTDQDIYSDVFHTGQELVKDDSLNINGKTIFIEIKVTPVFQQGKVVRAVTVIRDVTERKNFEKRIMNAIIETEEKERKRFSEDLHDELGSLLSTIKIYINTLHKEEIEAERKNELVGFTNQLIDQAIQNSKEIANNLSPNVIKRFGLISAITSFCEKIQASAGVAVHFDASAYSHKLKEDEEISIYRIVNELVNNTLKHARASHIDIVFMSSNKLLTICYNDDGEGFDFEKTLQGSSKGLGLQNIASRVNSLNGTYKVSSGKPDGFSIQLELLLQ